MTLMAPVTIGLGPPLLAVSNPVSGFTFPLRVSSRSLGSRLAESPSRPPFHSPGFPSRCNREQKPPFQNEDEPAAGAVPSRAPPALSHLLRVGSTASERASVTRGSRRRQRHPPVVFLPPKSNLPPHITTENSNPSTSAVCCRPLYLNRPPRRPRRLPPRPLPPAPPHPRPSTPPSADGARPKPRGTRR